MSEAMGPNSSFDILDLSGFFWRRKWHLMLGLLLGVALAAMHFLLTPPSYTAEVEVLVGQRSGDLANGATADAATEGVQAEQDILSTHIKIMTSRKIIGAALKREEIKSLASIREAEAEGLNTISYVQDHLEVEKGGEGMVGDAHVLIATFTDPSPEDCATVLQAIYDEYSAYLKQQFQGTSTEAIQLFTDLVRENAEAVKDSESKIASVLSNSRLLWDGDSSRNIHKERFDQIETRLREIASERSQIEARLKVITAALETDQSESISDLDRLSLLSEKEINRLKLLFDMTRGDVASEAFQAEQPIRQQAARAEYEEYLALMMREKKLLEKFSEGHPTVVSVREQIDMMRQFIDANSAKVAATDQRERMAPAEMLSTYVGLLNNDISDLRLQYEVLYEQGEIEMKAAKEMETVEMEVDTLRRDILRRKEIFENSQDTLAELSFVRDYAGFSTDIIGAPEPQSKPSWPQLPISGAVGLMIGGMLGLGLALAAELADQTFRSVDDLEQLLACDVIAHVPKMDLRKLRKAAKKDKVMNRILCNYHDPRGRSSEVFRVARTSLLMQAKRRNAKVFSVTSPAPGDGKSTMTSNLAISLAQIGKRVLVIDADLRRPSLAKLFGVANAPGVTDIVLGDCALSDIAVQSQQENLFILGPGTMSSAPSEILESYAFESLIEEARGSYDFVLIDTPPVLAVTDPIVVAKLADLLILTVRLTKTSRSPVATTCKLLAQAELPPSVAVVNLVDAKNEQYGYSRGYGYNTAPYSDQYYGGYEPSAKVSKNGATANKTDAIEIPLGS